MDPPTILGGAKIVFWYRNAQEFGHPHWEEQPQSTQCKPFNEQPVFIFADYFWPSQGCHPNPNALP